MQTPFKFYCSLDVHIYYPEIVLQYMQTCLKIHHICLLMLSIYLGKIFLVMGNVLIKEKNARKEKTEV